jgi:hypothetical protein
MSTHSTNPLPRIPDAQAARQGDDARRYWPDAWSPHSSLAAHGRDCGLHVAHLVDADGRPSCGAEPTTHDDIDHRAVQLCARCMALGPPECHRQHG